MPQAYETHGYEEEVRLQAFYQSNIFFIHVFSKAIDTAHGAEWHEKEVWAQVFHKSTHGYLALFVPCRAMRPMAMKRK